MSLELWLAKLWLQQSIYFLTVKAVFVHGISQTWAKLPNGFGFLNIFVKLQHQLKMEN